MKVSALVVDDEPIARHAVVRLLREDPDIAVAGECGDGVSAVAAIRDLSPDLVFLDIQMPAITGLDVVATIGAPRMPASIFVTAYEQFAVRAFDANAVDPLARMQLHSDSFRAMTAMVRDAAERHAGGRLVVVHEGGYSEAYVPFCGLAVIEELSGVRSAVRDPLRDFIELQLGTAQLRQQFSEHAQGVDDLRGERDHGDDRHRAHIARHGLQHAEASCDAEDEINHDALGNHADYR